MTVVVGEKELIGMAVSTERRLAYRPAELAAMVGLSAKAIYRAVERGELEGARGPAAAAAEEAIRAARSRLREEGRALGPGRVS